MLPEKYHRIFVFASDLPTFSMLNKKYQRISVFARDLVPFSAIQQNIIFIESIPRCGKGNTQQNIQQNIKHNIQQTITINERIFFTSYLGRVVVMFMKTTSCLQKL